MAKIGTKNGSNGRERDFVMRQAMARPRSAAVNATMPPIGSKRAKREERLDVPHANARSLAKTTPEGLSQHKGKVDDDRKTGMVKRRVNAFVEPNAH